jgi:hypothetical protein
MGCPFCDLECRLRSMGCPFYYLEYRLRTALTATAAHMH